MFPFFMTTIDMFSAQGKGWKWSHTFWTFRKVVGLWKMDRTRGISSAQYFTKCVRWTKQVSQVFVAKVLRGKKCSNRFVTFIPGVSWGKNISNKSVYRGYYFSSHWKTIWRNVFIMQISLDEPSYWLLFLYCRLEWVLPTGGGRVFPSIYCVFMWIQDDLKFKTTP